MFCGAKRKGWITDMKKGIERIISNRYIQVAIVCLIMMSFIVFFGYFFLLSVRTAIPADLFSALVNIIVITTIILNIIVVISMIIMAVKILVYGIEVRHDKTYWEVEVCTQVMETENNPYWLPVRYNNPILPFVIGLGCYIAVPCFIWIYYLHFELSGFMQKVLFILIEYVLIVAIVILIRLVRRFRAFEVKLTERI